MVSKQELIENLHSENQLLSIRLAELEVLEENLDITYDEKVEKDKTRSVNQMTKRIEEKGNTIGMNSFSIYRFCLVNNSIFRYTYRRVQKEEVWVEYLWKGVQETKRGT